MAQNLEVKSILDERRGTWTPAFVMMLARGVCESVRANLGTGRITARLLPDHGKTLMAHLQNESNCTYMFCVNFDRAYKDRPPSSGMLPLEAVDAPDFPEALHIIGIVFDSLGVTITDIGQRDLEENPDVLMVPLRGKRKRGQMARCLRHADRISRPLPPAGLDMYRVDTDGNDTPVEVLNCVVNAARRIRRIILGRSSMAGGWVKVSMWGYRQSPQRGPLLALGSVAEPLSPNTDVTLPHFVVRFSSERGRHHDVLFALEAPEDTDTHYFVVPCFMLALHMAGMLIDALDAEVIAIGNRHWEKNEDALARPLERMIKGTPVFHVGISSRMGSALNFVMPFGPEER